jgi:hypothetical protein
VDLQRWLNGGVAAIDEVSARMLAAGMTDGAHPVYLSTLRVAAGDLARRHPGVEPTATRRESCAAC